MPAPAAQFSPELPWAAGTRGTIILKEPVSKDDLVNGGLTFINGNGFILQPEDNDGYVDYRNEDDDQVLSVAINDDESKKVLVVGVAQDADVQRVVVGPAVGNIETILAVTEDLEDLPYDEEGFLIVECSKGETFIKAALTQDGVNIITALRTKDDTQHQFDILFSDETAKTANSTLKLNAKPPTGEIANLPKLSVEIISENNDAAVLVLHAPCDGFIPSGAGLLLYKMNAHSVEWGEQITVAGNRVL